MFFGSNQNAKDGQSPKKARVNHSVHRPFRSANSSLHETPRPYRALGAVAIATLTALWGSPATAQSFTNVGAGLAPLVHSVVAWADYDRDGRLDCLIAGSTSPGPGGTSFTGLYRNLGNDAFGL